MKKFTILELDSNIVRFFKVGAVGIRVLYFSLEGFGRFDHFGLTDYNRLIINVI